MKKYILILMSLFLLSCSHINYEIDDTTYRAKGKNNRIKFIILHYTATTDKGGLKTLTKGQVSSHYLITTKDSSPIYNLVDEHDRAWHAGVSSFHTRHNINDTSIGIEISNLGLYDPRLSYEEYGFFVPYSHYCPYSQGQLKKVAYLLQKLIKKYNIKPTNILGHSDVAPTRKMDPGPKFPWEALYKKYHIGAWYNSYDKYQFMDEKKYQKLSIRQIKREFKKYGYDINDTNTWDEASSRVIYNFQAHFNPKNASGIMDLETYAILMALNKKYR